MAIDPKLTKAGAKKPPAQTGESQEPSQDAWPADPTPKRTHAQGKNVRKNPGTEDVTRPVEQATVATVGPEESIEDQPMPAQKLSDPGAAPAPANSEKGATVLGDYKLLKKLGQGGMGAVYKAHQTSLDRVVAIKVLAKELASKEAYVARFKREAQVMAKLDHPNILRCFDVGQAKGFHFLSMEFVEGGSIENWLKKLGKFSVGDALHIILKTAAGLQHAHAKSMIHRDIKPDNILLTKEGVVKVADLGLAKDTSEDTSLTKTGAGAGTPVYMAPEQARDVKHVDSRVDIYALGVMMYVFLTGRAPFEGATLVELVAAKEKGKFDPIRKFNDEVPTKIDLIVDKMLAKDPKSRYASCQEVIDELEPLGLANDDLSFLAEEQAATKIAEGGVKRAGKTTGPAAPGKGAAKTAAGGKSPAADTRLDEEEDVSEKGVWYWKFVTPEGKMITKKLTTEQVRALIKAGKIEPTGELSKSEKSGFRTAGTFTEFHPTFKAIETTTKANVKGHKTRNRMQELAEEDARRRRWGWLSRMFKGFAGRVFGLLWIVLILALVGALAYLGWKYMSP